MTAAIFLAVLVVAAASTLLVARRCMSSRAFWIVAIGLPTWLAYVGALSLLGVVRDVNLRPPGIVYVFLPIALAWNVTGLMALANVVLRAMLTAPGPLQWLHGDLPNVAIGLFPFTYLAGFLAPVAVLLHILSIRALRAGSQGQASGAGIGSVGA